VDTRNARRSAEKAARELINARSAVIGELGVAHAERLKLAAEVDGAAEEGRRLTSVAALRAAELVGAAHDRSRSGQERYAEAIAAAVAAGWTMSDLRAMGFPDGRAAATRRRTGQRNADTSNAPAQGLEGADNASASHASGDPVSAEPGQG
jgi:hypothetical protein